MQIAVELAQGALVTLTSRTPVRFLPQRPLGRDIHFWLWLLGIDRLALPSLWQRLKSNSVLDAGPYQTALARGKPDWRPLFARLQPDSLADLGAWGEQGQILQQSGRSLTVPGLFYVGLSFQRTSASATLRGVGPDAAQVVRQIEHWPQRDALR